MRVSIEGPSFGVFNVERFKRYGLLLAYRVHDAAAAVIERLEEDGDVKAERSKRR
jgi:hypothetical protein